MLQGSHINKVRIARSLGRSYKFLVYPPKIPIFRFHYLGYLRYWSTKRHSLLPEYPFALSSPIAYYHFMVRIMRRHSAWTPSKPSAFSFANELSAVTMCAMGVETHVYMTSPCVVVQTKRILLPVTPQLCYGANCVIGTVPLML